METIRTNDEPIDIDGQMAAYLDRLKAWPLTDIERVLSEWPRRNKFWPAWAELEAELPDRVVPIRPAVTSGPAPVLLPCGRKAFETKEKWDWFMSRLIRLRQYGHTSDELAAGEELYARQLPHAQRMGWTQ